MVIELKEPANHISLVAFLQKIISVIAQGESKMLLKNNIWQAIIFSEITRFYYFSKLSASFCSPSFSLKGKNSSVEQKQKLYAHKNFLEIIAVSCMEK